MSAVVRHNYAGIYVLQQAGVCELYQNKVLLARTDNTAIVDKLFFKLALEIASTRVGTGARAQLTADGKRAFGCGGTPSSSEEGEVDDNPSTADAVPRPLHERDEVEKMTLEVFKRPTIEEIAGECRKRGYARTDPQAFYDYYESRNPPTKGAKAEDWRLALSGWWFHEWDKERLMRLGGES